MLENTVSVIARAVSPLERCVIRLDVGPAGQEANIIKPTASSSWRPKTEITNQAINGKPITWNIIPSAMALGYSSTLLKSSITRVSPMPSIIKAKANGKKIWVIKFDSILDDSLRKVKRLVLLIGNTFFSKKRTIVSLARGLEKEWYLKFKLKYCY